MARSTSEEEIQLRKRARRRLVGAVVLAIGVAVVLPMVLDTEPRPVSQNVNIQIPSPDAPGVQSAPPPLAAAPEPADAVPAAKDEAGPAEKTDPRPAPPREASGPAGADPAPTVQPSKNVDARSRDGARTAAKPEAPAPKSKPREAAKPAADGQFVVQVAALSDAAKARQLQQQVAATGVKTYTEVVKTAKGSVTRVRAGPYESREAAEKALGRLKSAGLDGRVVPR